MDGKRIGVIHGSTEGWRYQPKGTKTFGDPYTTLADCKRSLEEE